MKKLFLLFIASASLTSCLVDDEITQSDDTQAYIVGFKVTTKNISHFVDEGTLHYDVPFDLLGGYGGTTSDSDIVLNVEVDPSSTAVAGNEYDLTDSGTATLSAGTAFGNIGLEVHTGNFDPSVATTLVLNLTTSSSGVVVSELNKQVVVQFVGCISTIQTGSYTVLIGAQSTVYGGQSMTQTVSMIDVNTFRTSETLPFVPGSSYVAGLPYYGVEFEDVCGEITIPGQYLFNYYSNWVEGVNYTGGVLDDQQGVVVDSDTFVIYYQVPTNTNTYYNYLTFTHQ